MSPFIENQLWTLLTLVGLITLSNSVELCEPWKRVELHDAHMLANTSIWDSDNQNLYPPNSYCDNGGDNETIYGCPCKLEKPCMRKCCQKSEAMDYDTLQCILHNATLPWFRPNVTAEMEGNFRMEDLDYFGLIYGNYCFGYLLEPEFYPEEDQFFVNFTDGTLFMPQAKKFGLGPEDYCLEYFPEKDIYLPYVCFRTLGKLNMPSDRCDRLRYMLYPLGMTISSVFLAISLCIYVLKPELRNVHGKCLMCHMVSLLSAYIFLTIIQGFGSILPDNVCGCFGFGLYFSLLSTFFWLNIVCIDIYLAFSSKRLMSSSIPECETKKFLHYMLYAWGGPLLIIVITVIMELHPDIPDTCYKPKFKRTCWFNSKESKMLYYVLPVGVIVLCNIILFLVTAHNIFKMKKEIKEVTKGENGRHYKKEDRNRFKLYIRLSTIMGISWAMEILSWLIGGSKCVWLFTDTLNTLQGLFIFFIFLWKKEVRNLFKKKNLRK